MMQLKFRRMFLYFLAGITHIIAANLDKDNLSDICTVQLNSTTIQLGLGHVLNTDDPCVKYVCKFDENDNVSPEKVTEQCRNRCRKGYEIQSAPGRCCGLCVKTKCLYVDKLYSVGETWRNEDRCMLFECILENGSPVISTYKKSCPELPDCLPQDIYTKDCCQYCKEEKSLTLDRPLMRSETSIDTYHDHPCKRPCVAGAAPMICSYKFQMEWYDTLSKACYNCPLNGTDCSRPHCITGDGVRKSVLVVNRSLPGPAIEVCVNDTIIVDVKNLLLGDSTTLHWHGFHQRQNPYMDGVPNLTQCPIIPYTTFRYTFEADISGTHFWHSHVGLQRGDGCYGALIIRQPEDPHAKLYDYDLSEHVVITQDWIHTNGMTMFTNHHHSIGDNKPVDILVNGKGRYLNPNKVIVDPVDDNRAEGDAEQTTYGENDILRQDSIMRLTTELRSDNIERIEDRLQKVPFEVFNVTKGYRYRFRTINSGFLNCPIQISVDNHSLLVIQSDGFNIEPIEVKSFVAYAGERFDFVLSADQDVGNYWMRFKGLMDCDERFENVRQVAVVRYFGAPEVEPTASTDYNYPVDGLELNSLNKGSGHVDSLTIAEVSALDEDDEWLKQEEPDYKFYVYYDFYNTDNSMFYHPPYYGTENDPRITYTPQLNHISLKIPPVPILPARDEISDSLFCNETSLAERGIDCRKEFCECHHVLQVSLNSVVEIVLVDEGHTYDANHPFHLHGYAFRVIGMDRIGPEVTIEQIKDLDNRGQLQRNLQRPPIKDTVTVPDGGYTIIRFKANNPGYWLFHCHIEFHAELGMALILKVGENSQMAPVPKDFPKCSNYMPVNVKNGSVSLSMHFAYLVLVLRFFIVIFE